MQSVINLLSELKDGIIKKKRCHHYTECLIILWTIFMSS